MLKNFKPRLYQETIFNTTVRKNTLVVLPTGMGKSLIFVMLAAQRLKQYPDSKVLILAPTKPLVDQHAETLKKSLDVDENKIIVLTGQVSPKKREALWKEAQVICSTPQGLENDAINKKINFEEVSLLVFDECVAKGTLIHLANGEKIKIEDIEEKIKKGTVFVESLNEKTGDWEPSKIIKFHKIRSNKGMVVIHSSNSKIKTTSDHLFLSKVDGKIKWAPVSKLNTNDEIVFMGHGNELVKRQILVDREDILKQYSQQQQNFFQQFSEATRLREEKYLGARKISKIMMIKEGTIRNWINKPYQKPVSWRLIKEFEERRLLPLYSNDPYLPLFARLFGHLYGDGWAYRDKRNNLILNFSGEIEDLKIIQKNLSLLGLKYSSIYSRKTRSEIESLSDGKKIVEGISNSFSVADKGIVKLFFALGVPVGNKTKNLFLVPEWIMGGSQRVKNEFLSALMGSEGCVPQLKKNKKTCNPVRLSFNLLDDLQEEGLRYAKQIKQLFSDFKIPVSISKRKGNKRKDGGNTMKFLLTISNSNKNMKRFLEEINYTYSIRKRMRANSILDYLTLKEHNLKGRICLYQIAREMHEQGDGSHKIAKKLGLSKGLVENWIYYQQKPAMISATMEEFDLDKHFSKENRFSVKWRKINKIKVNKNESYVYDLTVEKNHNYIANNFVVHNCHHATGDYSYVWLAKQYNKLAAFPRILGLTASPGSDLEKIKETCQNLLIEEVEVRTNKDPDVKPYIQEVDYEWVKVKLPSEFLRIKKYLEDCYKSKLNEAQGYGYCSYTGLNKTDLIKLQGQLQGRISSGERNFEIMKSVSLIAEALKVQHALELLETQGLKVLDTYLQKLQKESLTTKVKAVKNLVRDGNFRSALVLVGGLMRKGVKHPKLVKLKELIEEETGKGEIKIIIFTQFRDTALEVFNELDGVKGAEAKIFVGQVKKGETGLSQKEQKKVLEEFRKGKFNVCVMTSVGEEGLDVPSVDLVIFYEPIPSAIRTIQRKGRTGRLEKGRVLVLMTEKTRDEGYRWSAFHKEKKMYRDLEKIKKEFSLGSVEVTLDKFVPKEQEVLVLADYREKSGGVVKELVDLGISLELKQLESADYVLSGRVGVERKGVADFVGSIIDGRLLEQVKYLKKNFERSLLVIEGEEDIYSVRKVHANAIRGMLGAITIGYGVPVLYTKNAKDTAGLLAVIAKREQDKGRDYSLHSNKPLTLKEQQEFLVSSLPGIGLNTAKMLLEKFGSVKKLVNASEEELMGVEGVGEKISGRIKEVLEKKYEV